MEYLIEFRLYASNKIRNEKLFKTSESYASLYQIILLLQINIGNMLDLFFFYIHLQTGNGIFKWKKKLKTKQIDI